jgi:hypothetical protein
MIVLTAQDVYVQCAPRRHGERVEYVRNHLCREVANLFAFEAQFGHAVRARANVDDRARKSLSYVRRDACLQQEDRHIDLPHRAEQSQCRSDECP